ncbi:MAG: TrkH family potassium uptake protein [Firmicutes bacterium]|nr:TrkH family potassium uptake protein [Bacillota bacterium]
MHFRLIIHSLGTIVLLLALTMILPLFWAIKDQSPGVMAFVFSILVTAGVGLLMKMVRPVGDLNRRDGFVIVGFGWLLIVSLGALPLYLSGTTLSYTDAFFESMSGFTTTGATVLTDLEAVSREVLFWRSLSHWLGGMGIILLSLAIFPFLPTGITLFQAEVPGLAPERFLPRLKQTAVAMWLIYAALSLLQMVALCLAGLSFFESIIHTFGTVSTGGFSSRDLSMQAFADATVEWVVIIFMFLSGVNFTLYYRLLRRKSLQRSFAATEFKWYGTIILFAAALIAYSLVTGVGFSPAVAFRYGLFQAVSVCTTTGFAVANFATWPSLAKGVLFLLMFVGGCTGSTAGSLKVARVVLLFKYALRRIRQTARPRLVIQNKFGDTAVSDRILHETLSFFFLYIALFLGGVLIVMGTGEEMLTSISAAAAAVGNAGPGFAGVGPAGNYAHLHPVAKWVLSFLMLAGRLEILTVLVLFTPGFWRR